MAEEDVSQNQSEHERRWYEDGLSETDEAWLGSSWFPVLNAKDFWWWFQLWCDLEEAAMSSMIAKQWKFVVFKISCNESHGIELASRCSYGDHSKWRRVNGCVGGSHCFCGHQRFSQLKASQVRSLAFESLFWVARQNMRNYRARATTNECSINEVELFNFPP